MIEERTKYYFEPPATTTSVERSHFYGKPIVVDVTKGCLAYDIFCDLNKSNQAFTNSVFHHGHWWGLYVKPVAAVLNKYMIGSTVQVAIGDNRESFNSPTIVKSRSAGSTNCILFKLNAQRHWGPCSDIRSADISIEDKRPAVCWRGTTTGIWRSCLGSAENSARYNLMRVWGDSHIETINVGLNKFSPSTLHAIDSYDKNLIQRFTKGHMSIQDQLKYLFVLSLEGNDVASNLKWILNSNSIPVMPIPTVESWAMEFTLQPWVNYVPILHDTTDLVDQINLALKDFELIKEIANNNRIFIGQFFDHEAEDTIMGNILRLI